MIWVWPLDVRFYWHAVWHRGSHRDCGWWGHTWEGDRK